MIETKTDVEIKTVAPQRVLGLHRSLGADLDDADRLGVEALFERVITSMDAAGADRSSPLSWRDDDGDTRRLHAGFVAHTANVPGLDVVELPGVTVAMGVRRGAVADLNEAHNAIVRWAEAPGRVLSVEGARWRELYLEANDTEQSDWLIEVQLELGGS